MPKTLWTRWAVLALFVLAADPFLPAQVGPTEAKRRYAEGLRSGKLEDRQRAITEYIKLKFPEAAGVLLEDVQKISVRVSKLREELQKLGDKLDAERIKRLGPYAGKSSHPASLEETIQRALAPIRSDISKVEERLAEEELVRTSLGEALGTLTASLQGDDLAKAVEILVLRLESPGRPEQEVEVLRALAHVELPPVQEFLIARSRLAPAAAVRLAALEALSRKPPDTAELAALQALADDYLQVRVAALKLLRLIGGRDCITPLIDALDGAEGRLVDEVVVTLRHLTKVDYHDNHDLWREWWSKNAGRYEGRGASGRLTGSSGGEPSPGSAASSDPDGRGTYFYGIRTRSKHIIYVLDISGSMNWAIDAKASPGAHRGQGPQPPDAPEGERKVDDALDQLVQSVAALPEDGTFNIVIYSDEIRIYAKGMVTATTRNKANLRSWAKKVTAAGATNIYDALERGFGLVGRGAFDPKYRVTADTIYFLSDGVPTVGRTLDADEILRQVGRWNEARMVKVHTVGLGESIDPRFMRLLAEQTDGQFVHKTR